MSDCNKYGLKTKMGSNIPFFHKKNNSFNFTLKSGKFLHQNSKKFTKNKIELKNIHNNNSKYSIVNNSNYTNKDSNITKLLTSINKNNRKIEINTNKYYSPTSRLNKSSLEKIIILKKKQYTSLNNINKKFNNENSKKDCNIINKQKKSLSKNRKLSNINININYSKDIISTYYNKSKNKKNIIIQKKSIYSLNKELKESKNKKFNKINNRDLLKPYNSEQIKKNQSSNIIKNNQTSKSPFANNISDKENNKNSLNLNSLGHFSTNSNMSTNTNKYNNHNSKKSINKGGVATNFHINYTFNDIFVNNSNIEYNNKNKGNIINKIIRDNKTKYLSQIKIPINLSNSPKNFNSIQNYLKYLKVRQNFNRSQSRTKIQKLSASNINYIHNKTENNTYDNIFNNTFNYEYNKGSIKKYYKYNKKYLKEIPLSHNKNFNSKDKSKKKNIFVSKRNKRIGQKYNYSSFIYNKKEINETLIECPEELHYYFVKIFQKGKNINFEHKKCS